MMFYYYLFIIINFLGLAGWTKSIPVSEGVG
jgi:hypothetical protein